MRSIKRRCPGVHRGLQQLARGNSGGSVRVIVGAPNRCIENQDTIDKILAHLRSKEQDIPILPLLVPPTRAPPDKLPLFARKDSASTEIKQHGSQ